MNKISLLVLPLLLVTLLPSCGGTCCKKSCKADTCTTKELETRNSGPMQDGIDFEDEDMK